MTTPRAGGVLEYHERGRMTRRAPPLPLQGPVIEDGGLEASFSLQLGEGKRVSAARFHATSCTTLIAYCQLATELANGRPAKDLARLDPASLTDALQGVPAMRQDRAVIATAALRAAALAAERQHGDPEEEQ